MLVGEEFASTRIKVRRVSGVYWKASSHNTEVPRELDGQGIASKLVKTPLDDARRQVPLLYNCLRAKRAAIGRGDR